MTRTVADSSELRTLLVDSRRASMSIGFVPTMGALHEGHLQLADASTSENDLTVMSIYVNPTQFGPHEDLTLYPRMLERDTELAAARGVDIVFTPTDDEIYPRGVRNQLVWVDPGVLGQTLEGRFRPGHFRAVATVVTKLFNIVQPDRAYFGQKDAQQAVVIRRLTEDLNMATTIRVRPTARDADGLALSSRNAYLTPDDRPLAPALYQALRHAWQAVADGERDADAIVGMVEAALNLRAPSAVIQYVALTDATTLAPLMGAIDKPALLSAAVYFGTTRLIDNIVLLSDA
jgi:pantoate--beta-alanine ligase